MLKSFADKLQEQGYETHFIEASETAPLDQLVVALEPDERGRERSLWLTPMAGLDEVLEAGLSLLQFLVTLPFPALAETEAVLDKQILQLNNDLPLGGFGVRHPEGVIFYRCVLMLGTDAAINARIVSETISLINYLLDRVSNAIEDATRGS